MPDPDGYGSVMIDEPTPPASDEADPTQQTTPAGQIGELDDLIGETGADIYDSDTDTDDEDDTETDGD